MTADCGITIRCAQERDLSEIARIDERWSSVQRRLVVEQAVLARRCIVAVERDAPVAYAIVRHDWFGQSFIELLVVGMQHRRRGIGRRVLEHVVESIGPGKVFTSTNQSNTAMRHLLESSGFRPSGAIDNLDENDPELVYVRFA